MVDDRSQDPPAPDSAATSPDETDGSAGPAEQDSAQDPAPLEDRDTTSSSDAEPEQPLAETDPLEDQADGDVPADDAVTLEDEAGEIVEARSVVEAILFATDSPLSSTRIAQIMGVGDGRSVRKHITALNETYERQGASYRIEEIAGGFQMLTLSRFNPWLAKLLRARQESRLSPAALETLAIVAYKQPVLRAEIEAIRGVSVGEVLARLRELNFVKIVGRDEQIGRPMLYGTTKRFLEVFGLASLKDLPKVEELKPPE